MTIRVLVIDDEPATCRMIQLRLQADRHEVLAITDPSQALEQARAFAPHVVLTDLNMLGMSGIDLCKQFGESWPDVPVIVITAFGTVDTAVQAIRAGAYDFIIKPFDIDALALAIDRAFQHHELKSEVKRLRAAVGQAGWADDIIGASPAVLELRSMLERVADTDATVFVTGETGTGKEVISRVLHNQSKRKNGPFVAVNCSALPEALLESELFGHVKGAFTDARRDKVGLFREANGGTLFLDEIGDMPLAVQVKLLRALEERQVRPLGGTGEQPFDARIIAATHRDLEEAVHDGRFREDLFYRLNVLNVELPPLRARGGDILLLAQHFLVHFSTQSGKAVGGISKPAAERLMAYSWPGNVRELRNTVERAVALTRFDHITVDDLPERIRTFRSNHVVVAGDNLDDLVPLEEVERRYILKVLQAAGGNKSVAAEKLGIGRRTLYRKLGE